MSNDLPKWSDCELAADEGRATALQRFVYEYEPGDRTEREWRERLQAIRQEERRAAFRDALNVVLKTEWNATRSHIIEQLEAAANETREDEDDG